MKTERREDVIRQEFVLHEAFFDIFATSLRRYVATTRISMSIDVNVESLTV